MMGKLRQHITQLLEAGVMAKKHYEIYHALTTADAKTCKAMNPYTAFFSPTSDAHQRMAIMRIFTIYDKKYSVNVHEVLKSVHKALEQERDAAGQSKKVKNARRRKRKAVNAIKDELKALQPIMEKIDILRHQDIAHRSRKLSSEKVFQKASLTRGELAHVVSKTWKITVHLLKLVEEPNHVSMLSSKKETLALLKDLTAHYECQLARPEEVAR